MGFDEIIAILKMSDLFCELSDRELQSIAELCRIEDFEAGDEIYQQNSIGITSDADYFSRFRLTSANFLWAIS